MVQRGKVTYFLTLVFAVIVGVQAMTTWKELAKDPLTISHVGPDLFVVKPGDAFEFMREVCVSSDITADVHREFYHVETGMRYILPSATYVGYSKIGCHTAIYSVKVPEEIPPGLYEYRPVIKYRVNSALDISKPAPPIKVKVLQ